MNGSAHLCGTFYSSHQAETMSAALSMGVNHLFLLQKYWVPFSSGDNYLGKIITQRMRP